MEVLDAGVVAGLRRGERDGLAGRWLATHDPAALAAAISGAATQPAAAAAVAASPANHQSGEAERTLSRRIAEVPVTAANTAPPQAAAPLVRVSRGLQKSPPIRGQSHSHPVWRVRTHDNSGEAQAEALNAAQLAGVGYTAPPPPLPAPEQQTAVAGVPERNEANAVLASSAASRQAVHPPAPAAPGTAPYTDRQPSVDQLPLVNAQAFLQALDANVRAWQIAIYGRPLGDYSSLSGR